MIEKRSDNNFYDWDGSGDFSSSFRLTSQKALNKLRSFYNVLQTGSLKTVDDDPLLQSKKLLIFIRALRPTVLDFFTHKDNISNRVVKLDDQDDPAITYGLHDLEGNREYGLLYHTKNGKTVPVTHELLTALLTGNGLPEDLEKDELTVLRFASKSRLDILNTFIKRVELV